MKKILGICDSDAQYAEILSDNLRRRESFPFEISTFEDEASASSAAQKGIITVLLISEGMYEKCKDKNPRNVKIIVLAEGNGDLKTKEYIWKYQSAENIRKEILSLLTKDDNLSGISLHTGRKLTKIIGIYSLSRLREVSSYAISMGKRISRKDKVLYISFKGMSKGREYLEIKDDKDITDLIYYQRNARDRFSYSFEGLVSSDKKLDYIAPAYSFVDVKSVPKEDWLDVLTQIRDCCDYEYVILELSESIDGFLEVLRCCDSIVVLCEDGEKESRVMKEFNEILENMDYGDIVSKSYISTLPCNLKAPGNAEELIYGKYAEFVGNDLERICSLNS